MLEDTVLDADTRSRAGRKINMTSVLIQLTS